jgi:hypothetical protein
LDQKKKFFGGFRETGSKKNIPVLLYDFPFIIKMFMQDQ